MVRFESLYGNIVWMGKGNVGRVNHRRKDDWVLRRTDGDVIVCDKVCLGAVSNSSFLSCGKGQCCPVGETLEERIYDN